MDSTTAPDSAWLARIWGPGRRARATPSPRHRTPSAPMDFARELTKSGFTEDVLPSSTAKGMFSRILSNIPVGHDEGASSESSCSDG